MIRAPSYTWIGILLAVVGLVIFTFGLLFGHTEWANPTAGRLMPPIAATAAALDARERVNHLSATETVDAREQNIGAAQQRATLTTLAAAPTQTAAAETYRGQQSAAILRETSAAAQKAEIPFLLIVGLIAVVGLLVLFGLRHQEARIREENARAAAERATAVASDKRNETLDKQIQLEREKRRTLQVSATIQNKNARERADWH